MLYESSIHWLILLRVTQENKRDCFLNTLYMANRTQQPGRACRATVLQLCYVEIEKQTVPCCPEE